MSKLQQTIKSLKNNPPLPLFFKIQIIQFKNEKDKKDNTQEYFLAYRSDVSYFTMQQFIEKCPKDKLSELEYLILIKDMVRILKQLERNKVGHRNISTDTLFYSFKSEQKQWVLKDFFKSQMIDDISHKQEVTTIYGKLEYISPEVAKEINDKANYFSKFSLKAQDVYAMGIVLAKVKLGQNQTITNEQIEAFLINDKFLRNKDLKVSDYIIGLMLSTKEKDRMELNYRDIITLIEEEFFSLYKVYKKQNTQQLEKQNFFQNYENIIKIISNEVTDNQMNQYMDYKDSENQSDYPDLELQKKQTIDMEGSNHLNESYLNNTKDKISVQHQSNREAYEKERIEKERKQQKDEAKKENRLKKLLEFLKFIKNLKNREQYQLLAEEILDFIQNKMRPSQQNLHEEFEIIQQLVQLHDESLEQIQNDNIIEDQQKIGEAMQKKNTKKKQMVFQIKHDVVDEADEYSADEESQSSQEKKTNLFNLREKESKQLTRLRFNIIQRTFQYQNFFLSQKQKNSNPKDEEEQNRNSKFFKKIQNNQQNKTKEAKDDGQANNLKDIKVKKLLNYEFKFNEIEQTKNSKDNKEKKILSQYQKERKIDIFETEPLNQNLQLLIDCYDSLIQLRVQMADFYEDLEDLKALIIEHQNQIDNLDQILIKINGYLCKCFYDKNQKLLSKEIFLEIENKIEKWFCHILRSQYIEDIKYNEFDESQWDKETAIEVLKQIQKRDKRYLQQYVDIELRIAKMYLELSNPNYLESIYKYENVMSLYYEFSQEIEINQLESISDIYQIMYEEKLNKIANYREKLQQRQEQEENQNSVFTKKNDVFKAKEKYVDYIIEIKHEQYLANEYERERKNKIKQAISKAKELQINQKDIDYLKQKQERGKPNLIKKLIQQTQKK